MKAKLVICMVLGLLVAGCITSVDPETGKTLYSLDPNVVSTIEPLVETGITIGTILAAIFPVLVPIVTAAGGIYGTWKKLKPQVVKAQTEAGLYHTAVSSLVQAIEDYKESDPEGWEKLKAKIKVGDKVENVIRAIRLLPPIE